jgi:hypothetical protein
VIGDDLSLATVAQREGRVYVVGLNTSDLAVCQESDDGGATKSRFPVLGTTSAPLLPDAVEQDHPALTILPTGELLALVTQGDRILTLVSRDDGEHWSLAGSIE